MSGFAKLKNAGESVSGKPQPLDLSDFSSGGSERRGNPREDQEIADRVARRHGLRSGRRRSGLWAGPAVI